MGEKNWGYSKLKLRFKLKGEEPKKETHVHWKICLVKSAPKCWGFKLSIHTSNYLMTGVNRVDWAISYLAIWPLILKTIVMWRKEKNKKKCCMLNAMTLFRTRNTTYSARRKRSSLILSLLLHTLDKCHSHQLIYLPFLGMFLSIRFQVYLGIN